MRELSEQEVVRREKLENIDISEKDFNRKKKVLISNEVFAFESSETVGDIIVDNIVFDGKFEDNPIEVIESLNIEELLELIKKIPFDNTSEVIVKKGGDEKKEKAKEEKVKRKNKKEKEDKRS